MKVTFIELLAAVWSNPWARALAITLIATLLKATIEELKLVESPGARILLDFLVGLRLLLMASPFAQYIQTPKDPERGE